MKAAVYTEYGDPEVVRVVEAAGPRPRASELLISVRATTVTSADSRLRAMRMPCATLGVIGRAAIGVRGPRKRVLGTEVSGVVEEVGAGVGSFAVGDSVVALLGMRLGGHAERVCVAETGAVTRIPEVLSFDEAVSVTFGGMTALYYLRDLAKVKAGERVLVVGASGAVGVAAVALAAHFGAAVTGVCSGANVDVVKSVGAAEVIDYTREDFARRLQAYDVVFDTVGLAPFSRCKPVLAPGGRYLAAVLTMTEVRQMLWSWLFGGNRVLGGVVPERKQDLELLMDLAASGCLKPVIDSRFSLDEIVKAHRRVDSGRKVGSVIVTMGRSRALDA